MSDVWSDRAEAYRQSPIHAAGEDLDLVVEWCEPAAGVDVLDVATGGGHVARRLREAGANVVTVDPAPGMQADVIAPAEHLPFADRASTPSRAGSPRITSPTCSRRSRRWRASHAAVS